jgi:hypothetical protein
MALPNTFIVLHRLCLYYKIDAEEALNVAMGWTVPEPPAPVPEPPAPVPAPPAPEYTPMPEPPAPEYTPMPEPTVAPPIFNARHKTSLCPHRNYCRYGEACRFAHNKDELRCVHGNECRRSNCPYKHYTSHPSNPAPVLADYIRPWHL